VLQKFNWCLWWGRGGEPSRTVHKKKKQIGKDKLRKKGIFKKGGGNNFFQKGGSSGKKKATWEGKRDRLHVVLQKKGFRGTLLK